MNINTTSSYTYGSSSSKGLSGLASGMDTETMVKEMLSGTQSKIDAQKALKQQTEWKQEIYRDLIKQINSLQSKFFTSSSSTALTSSAFFNAMSAVTKSSILKATATTSAVKGNTSIEVHQLATNHSLTSASGVSGKLSGKIDSAALQKMMDQQLTGDRKLVIDVQNKNGSTSKVTVDLKEHFVKDGKFVKDIDSDAIAQSIQTALKDQGGLEANVSMEGGQLSIVSTDMDRWFSVSEDSSAMALSAMGLEAGDEAETNATATERSLNGALKLAPTFSFSMTLDDSLKKNIEIDLRDLADTSDPPKIDMGLLQGTLQKAIDRQHGAGVVKVEMSGDTVEFRSTVTGRKVMIGGDREVLDALGLKNGQSNRIGIGGKLGDLFFQSPLQGDRFRFEINGSKFSFSAEDTIGEVIKKVNASNAGVTISYKPLDDKFVMQVNDSGAGRSIEMKQTEGNLLNAMFGSGDGTLKTGNSVSSGQIGTGTITGGTEYLDGVTKGSFGLVVDGNSYTLQVPEKSDKSAYTKTELLTELNKQLAEQVGTFTEGGVTKNRVEINSDGTMSVRDGAIVTIGGAGTTDENELKRLAKAGDLVVALGFREEKQSGNLSTAETTLADVGLSGLADALGINSTTKLGDLERLTAGKDVRFSFEDGRLVATSDSTKSFGAAEGVGDEMERLFGVKTITLADNSVGQASAVIDGQNAIVRIDGIFTERGSNLFTYNGINVELTDVSETSGGAAMTGTVYQRGADGTLTALSLDSGHWIDTNGYLRGADGGYLNADKDPVADQGQALQYQNLVYKDAKGVELSGVGINSDGSLLDSTGKALTARKTETISVTRNTDKIVEGVKGFIEEYNKLLEKINGYLDADADYRDYAPLTDEQRKELSEKQIELWEEKAKTGLLRRDSILEGFLQSMRSIWYEKNDSGYALYNLGIETGEWDKKGQLVMSADGEATLRKAIESDPNGVMSFFTNELDGAATRVNQVISKVANTSSGSPGTLVQLAGVKGLSSEKNNTLYNKIEDIDDKIEALKNTYEKERSRYWNQFNAMEQLISQMNSQSSWLSQQFSF